MEVVMHTEANPIVLELPTLEQAEAIRSSTWAGIDACELLDMQLARAADDHVGDALLTLEELGIATRLADSLATAAVELERRAERIRTSSVALSYS